MNAGIYAFDEAALRAAIVELRADNAQREYYLTDTLALLRARGRTVRAVGCDDFRLVLGINDRIELARARAALNERLCEAHMRARGHDRRSRHDLSRARPRHRRRRDDLAEHGDRRPDVDRGRRADRPQQPAARRAAREPGCA